MTLPNHSMQNKRLGVFMKTLMPLLCIAVVISCSHVSHQATKPSLEVTGDGFPSGHATPEGVACDLARAWMKRDVSLFTNTCLPQFGSGPARSEYEAFLARNVENIQQLATNQQAPTIGPKGITKVFAARHLSGETQDLSEHVADKIADFMFVDVESVLRDGKRYLHRTLVIKASDGKWYVHPAPEIDSRLSAALNSESASEKDLSDAYNIVK